MVSCISMPVNWLRFCRSLGRTLTFSSPATSSIILSHRFYTAAYPPPKRSSSYCGHLLLSSSMNTVVFCNLDSPLLPMQTAEHLALYFQPVIKLRSRVGGFIAAYAPPLKTPVIRTCGLLLPALNHCVVGGIFAGMQTSNLQWVPFSFVLVPPIATTTSYR